MRVFLVSFLFVATLKADPFPDTRPLEWREEDLSEKLMDGAHRFVDRKIDEANQYRSKPGAAEKETLRRDFRAMIGAVDELAPPHLEYFGASQSSLVGETETYSVHQARWQVLDGLMAEGLLVNPKANLQSAPALVLIPDAGAVPGKLSAQFASRGYRLLIPTTISRDIYQVEGDKRLSRSKQTYREWIYRQAFQMGRHVIGYEVQIARAGAKWLRQNNPESSVGIAGYGEGGLVALFAAAADPEIDHAFVSGYFGPKDNAWSEPIYRNLFNRQAKFGDAEVANLIVPRKLFIEHSEFPKAEDNKGKIYQPDFKETSDELGKIAGEAVVSEADEASVGLFSWEIGYEPGVTKGSRPFPVSGAQAVIDAGLRHERVFRSMEEHTQSLIVKADITRFENFFLASESQLAKSKWTTDREFRTLDPTQFVAKTNAQRTKFHEELIGRFDEEFVPLAAKSRMILDNEKWSSWDVVIPVYGDELFAWGVLTVPKNIKTGEKRPVVVCQHGRNGVPLDTVNAGKTAYSDFAAKLAERGYITFAPHNLYRGEDRYRWLDRKANAIGCSLFSFIIPSHRRILDWLKTVPQVDRDKIAFYGLSYGGESAMRIPAILEDYCLSICSGDFNQWTRKVAAVDYPGSFMRTIEWEMPYWNLGNTFDYAEMAGLIFPRPFMVERGHHDGVAPDSWVAHEYAKVRWLYAQFGLSERTEIEFFQGGHSIRGEGTFQFLDRFLKSPQ